MSVRQFANSLQIIRRSEDHNRGAALARHLYWQGRKLLFPRPVQLQLSRSMITDDEPGGVISMVNMLGCYDYNNMHFVQAVLAQAPTFIDVGANIGAYSLIASENPAVEVVAFEPIPAAFAKLRRNLALNGRRRVHALNMAASAQPGHLRMTCDGASSVNRVVEAGQKASQPAATTLVDVTTVDIACAELGLRPSLIKIDVEGHELQVLRGAAASLASCLACIVENGERPATAAFMRENGMAGPFWYRHRSSELTRRRQALPEDCIYVGAGFAGRVPGIALADRGA